MLARSAQREARSAQRARDAPRSAPRKPHEPPRIERYTCELACVLALALTPPPSLSRPYLPSQLPFRIQRNGVIEALPSASTCFK